MCSHQWLLRERARSMGLCPGPQGVPKASPGLAVEPVCPTLLPLCLVCAPPRLLARCPWRFWKFSGYLLVLSPPHFPFSLSGPPVGGDLLSERCLFCDDWHSVPCSPACLHCAASLSAFQARPSLLCVSLSFTPFPHFCLCRACCRLSSRPCQRPWELTGRSGPGGSCPLPAPAFSCPTPQEPSGVGLGLPSGVSMVPLPLGSGLLRPRPGTLHGPSAVCPPAQPLLPGGGHSVT